MSADGSPPARDAQPGAAGAAPPAAPSGTRSPSGAPQVDPVLARLRDPATIRARCAAITRAVDAGASAHFLPVARERLDDVAQRVAAVTRRRFPDLHIPFHSRWRHFDAGSVERGAALRARLAGRDPIDAARACIDLTVVAVLLDAGAGTRWRYRDADGRLHARSEGLGVASFEAFMQGRFSATPGDPLRVDADALARLDAPALAALLQVDAANPLVGLDGRAALLARLGRALRDGAGDGTGEGAGGRPGRRPSQALLAAIGGDGCGGAQLLAAVLALTAPVLVAGGRLNGQPLGDVWAHRHAGAEPGAPDAPDAGLVPLHKLSQWLAYSLLEPLRDGGIEVTRLDELTGLAEYRNGGLLIDAGVLRLRDPAALAGRIHAPGDEAIVEWRALTVTLLDELAPRVRERLGGIDAAALPLARMLEGGSWAAGREIAAERRADAAPPLTVASDGSVF